MTPILTYDPGDGRTILREGRGGSLVKLSDYEALEKRLAVVQAELEAAFPKTPVNMTEAARDEMLYHKEGLARYDSIRDTDGVEATDDNA